MTTIIVPSGGFEHLTIDDADGAPVPPSALSWTMDAPLLGLMTVARDGTGLVLTAAPGASSTGSQLHVSYSGGGSTETVAFDVELGKPTASITGTVG